MKTVFFPISESGFKGTVVEIMMESEEVKDLLDEAVFGCLDKADMKNIFSCLIERVVETFLPLFLEDLRRMQ